MNSFLFNLATLASMLIVVLANDDLSRCDGISQNFPNAGPLAWPDKAEAALEYIKQNCPPLDLLMHISYVKGAQQQSFSGGLAPEKNYRINKELQKEQNEWLAKAEEKVSDYFFELATILEEPEVTTGEKIEYPSSEAIDALLKEVDENGGEELFPNVMMTYLMTHNADRGIIKFLYVMQEAGKKQQ